MCVTFGTPTRLSQTIVYVAEVLHPTEGPVHVVGYQNTVQAHPGPGAMILPLPTDDKLGPQNIIEDEALKDTLKTYSEAVERMKPRLRGDISKRSTLGAPTSALDSFQVFDSGQYTVCLAESAPNLVNALQLVPENRRPPIDTHFIFELAKAYPKTPMALCCFNGQDFKADPLFWWYRPRDPNVLTAPAIDGHGHPPKLSTVDRDHTLIFGSYRAEGRRDGAGVRKFLPQHWALTDAIVGSKVENRMTLNGDFVFKVEDILKSNVPGYIGADQISVQIPQGWKDHPLYPLMAPLLTSLRD